MAITIHSDRVDLAHVQRTGKNRPKILSLESFKKEESTEETLVRLRKELKLAQYKCATILGYGEYQILQIESPNVPPEEMREAVRWKIKDSVEYPVQTATIDVLDIPSESTSLARQKSIFVIAANNQTIAPRMALFKDSKIPLEVIDIPEMAQRNIAMLYEEPERGLAMLSFDEYGGLLTFTHEGNLYLSRRIEITLTQLIETAPELRHSLFERISLELQRSLDHFDRQYSSISLTRLLLMPIVEVPELHNHLTENLYVPVKTFDFADVMEFEDIPELKTSNRQAQYLQIIGVALRTTGTSS